MAYQKGEQVEMDTNTQDRRSPAEAKAPERTLREEQSGKLAEAGRRFRITTGIERGQTAPERTIVGARDPRLAIGPERTKFSPIKEVTDGGIQE